jgi:hypothetical protein
MRLGLGPGVVSEWLAITRRSQIYMLRAGFMATILIGTMLVWHDVIRHSRSNHLWLISPLLVFLMAVVLRLRLSASSLACGVAMLQRS